MQKFNANTPIDEKLKNSIEVYFKYRWQNDRLLAITDLEDIEILEHLPPEIHD